MMIYRQQETMDIKMSHPQSSPSSFAHQQSISQHHPLISSASSMIDGNYQNSLTFEFVQSQDQNQHYNYGRDLGYYSRRYQHHQDQSSQNQHDHNQQIALAGHQHPEVSCYWQSSAKNHNYQVNENYYTVESYNDNHRFNPQVSSSIAGPDYNPNLSTTRESSHHHHNHETQHDYGHRAIYYDNTGAPYIMEATNQVNSPQQTYQLDNQQRQSSSSFASANQAEVNLNNHADYNTYCHNINQPTDVINLLVAQQPDESINRLELDQPPRHQVVDLIESRSNPINNNNTSRPSSGKSVLAKTSLSGSSSSGSSISSPSGSAIGAQKASPEKPNQCQICGRNYARPSTLKTHLRTHTNERPFKCGMCYKTFSQAANLTAHQRVHTGERPFSCPICGRNFSQSSSVITHLRTHSGERPYRCSMCSRTFSDSSTLTKHCRIHSGEKPYQCDFCALNFSQSGNLSRHLKLHMLSGGPDTGNGRLSGKGSRTGSGVVVVNACRRTSNGSSNGSSSSGASSASGVGGGGGGGGMYSMLATSSADGNV